MNTWRFFQMKGAEGAIMLQVRVLPPEICSWVLAALVRGRRPHGDWRFQQPKMCFYIQNWMGLSQWRYFFNFRLHELGLLILKYVSFSTWHFPFGHTVGFPYHVDFKGIEFGKPATSTTQLGFRQLPRGDFSRWSVRAQTFSKAVVFFCSPEHCHHQKAVSAKELAKQWLKLDDVGNFAYTYIHTYMYTLYMKWTVKASWWWSHPLWRKQTFTKHLQFWVIISCESCQNYSFTGGVNKNTPR